MFLLKYYSSILILIIFSTFSNLVFANEFYVGIDVGKSKSRTAESTPANSSTHYYLESGSSFNINGKDNITGLHFGYNYFINNFFIGPELRFIKKNQDTGEAQGRYSINEYSVKYEDTKTLALKLGIVDNKISYYLLGGFAQSDIYIKAKEKDFPDHIGESKANHNGSIFGVGVETNISKNASIGLQYSEINLKNKKQTLNDNNPGGGYEGPDVVAVKPNLKTLSLRMSYLF
jgi:opacity protein-like surface antigen